MVSQNTDVDSLLSDVRIPHISRHGLPVTSLSMSPSLAQYFFSLSTVHFALTLVLRGPCTVRRMVLPTAASRDLR